MEIKLGQTRWQARDHAEHVGLGEMAALMQSEERVGRADATLTQFAARAACERECGENRLAWESHARDKVLRAQINQHVSDDWVHVEVEVSVEVVEAAV